MGLPHHQCLIVVAHVLLFSVLCGPKAQWVGLLKTKSKHKGQKKNGGTKGVALEGVLMN